MRRSAGECPVWTVVLKVVNSWLAVDELGLVKIVSEGKSAGLDASECGESAGCGIAEAASAERGGTSAARVSWPAVMVTLCIVSGPYIEVDEGSEERD
jgi:hypothetical protein